MDLIKNRGMGFLYPSNDRATRCTYVEELVAHSRLRRRFSLAARGFTEQWGWATICAQLVEFYEEAVSIATGTTVDMR